MFCYNAFFIEFGFLLKGNSLKFLKYWFPVILYCCMIFGVSTIPGNQVPQTISVSDKLMHMTLYAGLSALFARAVAFNSHKPWPFLIWLLSLAFVSFYGITDEFHQSYVPGRSSDIQDWMADLIGGGIGAALYLLWLRTKQAKQIKNI